MNPTFASMHGPSRSDLGRTLWGRVARVLLGGAIVGALGLGVSCGGGSSPTSSTLTPTPIPAPTPTPIPTASAGLLTGQVKNYLSGKGISGATVTDGKTTVTTFADGTYQLTSAASDRKQITVTAPGFGDTQQITTMAAGGTSELNVFLVPSTITQITDLSLGATLTVPDSPAQVTLPSDALVAAGGLAPSFPVQASLTLVDPSTTPSLMPGDYTTPNDGEMMVSFGAMTVTFTDSKGARLNLAPGQTATIRIPLASAYAGGAPPATMPAFYYNEAIGRWIEEGMLNLGGTDLQQYYEGTVTHFTTWNADEALGTTAITGKVIRSIGSAAVVGAIVIATGADPATDPKGYIGTYKTVTASDGTFTVYAPMNASVIITATAKDVNNLPLNSRTPDIQISTGALTSYTIPAATANDNTAGVIKVEGSINLTGTLRDFSPSTPYVNTTTTPPVYVYPESKYAGDLRPYFYESGVRTFVNPTDTVAPYKCFDPATPWINPDFECHYGNWWQGMVKPTLGANNKPVYNNPAFASSLIHSQATFDAWWEDFPWPRGPKPPILDPTDPNYPKDPNALVPYQVPYTIKLTEADPVNAPGVYSYLNDKQFPFNESGVPGGMGNYYYNNPGDGYQSDHRSAGKNYHYTYEIHTNFTYKKGQKFTFLGDDDVWVFIDKKLAIDCGGVHNPVKGELNLDTGTATYTTYTDGNYNGASVKPAQTNPLNLVEGLTYQFDFFYCERHTTDSHMRITTSIAFPTTIPD